MTLLRVELFLSSGERYCSLSVNKKNDCYEFLMNEDVEEKKETGFLFGNEKDAVINLYQSCVAIMSEECLRASITENKIL